MTLDRLRPVVSQTYEPFVGLARALGLTPNAVSALGFLCAVGAGIAFLFAGGATVLVGTIPIDGPPALYLLGAALVFANGWFDLLDGELARELGTDSAAGDLLDHVLDRYADIVLVVGLAGGVDRYLLGIAAVTGVLMTSYLGTQAQAVGLERVYAGLVGRADRLALIGVVTAVTAVSRIHLGPLSLVGWLLVVLAVVGHLTAIQRFVHAFRSL